MAISKTVIIDSWGESPAKVHRPTGTMYINKDYIGKLTEDQWAFIIAHEAGHVKENTRNEFRADELASQKYFEQKRSPKNSVSALANVLHFKHPSHAERVRKQFVRAAIYDCETNKHHPSCNMVDRLVTQKYTSLPLQSGTSIVNYTDAELSQIQLVSYDEFVSAVDECRGLKRGELRRCRKTVRKTNKQDRKDTRNDAKADSRMELARQGIDVTSSRLGAAGEMLKGVGAAAAGVGAAALGVGGGVGLAKGLPNLMGGGNDGAADGGKGSGGNGILAGAKNLLSGGGVQGLLPTSNDIEGNSTVASAPRQNLTNNTPASTANEIVKKNADNTLLYVAGVGILLVFAVLVLRR